MIEFVDRISIICITLDSLFTTLYSFAMQMQQRNRLLKSQGYGSHALEKKNPKLTDGCFKAQPWPAIQPPFQTCPRVRSGGQRLRWRKMTRPEVQSHHR